jgi:hypothetical protein
MNYITRNVSVGGNHNLFVRLTLARRCSSSAANGVVEEPPMVVVLLVSVNTHSETGNSSSNACTKTSFVQMIL